ncbi:hypothetical protein B0H14DRAFT_2584273 [Mycena olivaceomarginata]|nr:hypothetical protein B0H14DRAFT_2584273 [Mycena olivaceomarginata]
MTISSHPKYTHQLGKYSFQSAGEWTFASQRDGVWKTAADVMGFDIGQAEGGKEGGREQGVETRSGPEEGTDVEGGKARRRACLESTSRRAKAQVRTHSSASHISAYVHMPSSSSISGGSKPLHGKKETTAEREEGSRPGGERRKREGAREQRRGMKMVGARAILVDPKCKALREVPGSARCIVPDRLGDYRAKHGCMECGQSRVRAVGQQSLGLEVVPFSEIVSRQRCSESSNTGRYLDEKGGRWKTRAGWEGLCAPARVQRAPGILGVDPGSQSKAARACKRMRAGVNGSARLRGGLAMSSQTVLHAAGGVCSKRGLTGGGKVPLPSPRSRPAAEPAFSPSVSACILQRIWHRASQVEEEMFGLCHNLCVKRVAMAMAWGRNTDKYGSVHDRRRDLRRM